MTYNAFPFRCARPHYSVRWLMLGFCIIEYIIPQMVLSSIFYTEQGIIGYFVISALMILLLGFDEE